MKNYVNKLESIKKYRFLILAAALGIVLLLLPSCSSEKVADTGDEERLERILESTDSVGKASVLLSENGVVVVCEGADSADVRLTVIKAVSAFTGFTTDKIQILKLDMED
ncbi:MAG: hypothetical protein Q4A83_02120 [Bacillota bacterium]|nr:hypothetical protein [Bacillota bacterium]